MFHFCYRTINMLDGMFYLGKHSTGNLKDGYIGSGKLISRAIKKHGRKNFKFEILCFFDSSDLAYEFEEVLVCPMMVEDPKCYNLVVGGEGGKQHRLGQLHTEESKARMRKPHGPMSQENKEKIRQSLVGLVRGEMPDYQRAKHRELHLGKKLGPMSEEQKAKLRKPKTKTKCCHCGTWACPGTLSRWHGDNCKSKPRTNETTVGE